MLKEYMVKTRLGTPAVHNLTLCLMFLNVDYGYDTILFVCTACPSHSLFTCVGVRVVTSRTYVAPRVPYRNPVFRFLLWD